MPSKFSLSASAFTLLLTSGLAFAKTGVEADLYSFPDNKKGGSPEVGVTLDAAGNLFGATTFMLYEFTKKGQYKVLHKYTREICDTAPIIAPVTLGLDGSVFVTVYESPSSACESGGVYKIAPDGTYTSLIVFDNTNGSYPEAPVILDATGNIYGTASNGGANGKGLIFKIAPDGTQSTIYTFSGPDGAYPTSMIFDSAGDLIGTTAKGGAAGYGTVFKLTPDGAETVLFSFDSAPLGQYPNSLILDEAGNMYGITGEGGGTEYKQGLGVIFKISPSAIETVLYVVRRRDGEMADGLALDRHGNLYAMASGGEIIRISKTGKASGYLDPPFAQLNGYPALDKNGDLFGTTFAAEPSGLLFKVSP